MTASSEFADDTFSSIKIDLSDFFFRSVKMETMQLLTEIVKGTLIGIVCGVAAVVLVAVAAIAIVVMRKKRMILKSGQSQSSILEDTGEILLNDKRSTVKNDDEADLDFWL